MGWVHDFKIWVCLKIECLKSWCFIGYIGLSVLSPFDNAIPHFQRDPFPPLPCAACCSAGGMAKAGPMPISLGSTPTWKGQGIRNTGGFMSYDSYEHWGFPSHEVKKCCPKVDLQWDLQPGQKPEMGMAEDLVPQECADATCRAVEQRLLTWVLQVFACAHWSREALEKN